MPKPHHCGQRHPFTGEDNLRLIDSCHMVLVQRQRRRRALRKSLRALILRVLRQLIIKRPGENDGQPSADCIEKLMTWINT